MTEMLLINAGITGFLMLLFGVLFRMVARLRDSTSSNFKDCFNKITEFRVEVAKEYVTNSYLKEVETRIMAQLDSLDGKLERLIRNSMKK